MPLDGALGILTLDSMTVMMLLEGGPLDGESQIVEMLPTTPGSVLNFNIPNFQTFDPNTETETVIGLGLQCSYSLLEQGPPPDTSQGDTWDTSWVFEFTGDSYIPTPPFLPPPPAVEVTQTQVGMLAESGLVPDTLPVSLTTPPTPVTVMLAAESAIDVESNPAGDVLLTGESVLTVSPDWSPQVVLTSTTSMEVDPS